MQHELAEGAVAPPPSADESDARSPIHSSSTIDFPQRVHLLGAGGAGVSGIGRILVARSVHVTGHDRADSALAGALNEIGVQLELGESSADRLPEDAELVIRSAAVPADDPQVRRAEELGIPVLKYADALGMLAPAGRTLAVAGTHGKTTASWMLWHALEGVGEELRSPVSGALIGGICRRLDTNALAGSRGGWFCVEACEYDRTFLHLSPRAALITNVEGDHLDYYGSIEAVREAFARFASQVADDGLLVVGGDVPDEVEVASGAMVWRLGRELEVDLCGEHRGRFRFRLRAPGWATPEVELAVPGHFNVENAALALALAVGLSARESDVEESVLAAAAARGIERFLGATRRFEPWGSVADVDVVHDYAHHPTEVRVTLEAARRAFPHKSLHVLFQPHQHSRTSHFLEDFAESLRGADAVVVTDVYGARTHIDAGRFAGSAELVLALRRRGKRASEGGPLGSSVDRFVRGLPRSAAAFVLGAGDVEQVRDELLQELALRCNQPS